MLDECFRIIDFYVKCIYGFVFDDIVFFVFYIVEFVCIVGIGLSKWRL